ncbi:MAG: hypothetical protein HOQ33_11315, partial [Cupriavidus sp.]|nr:hypothetical protein [Cupriavidus sp.]
MTKYCESCHTANSDSARFCKGCAGKFSGVRRPALISAPPGLGEAPAVPGTERQAPAAMARPAAVSAAVPLAEGTARTFARTAAGPAPRSFPRTHPPVAARVLARTPPRVMSRAPHNVTHRTAIEPSLEGFAKAIDTGPAQPEKAAAGMDVGLTAPTKAPAPAPTPAPVAGSRKRLFALLPVVALLSAGVLALRHGSIQLEDASPSPPPELAQAPTAATVPAPAPQMPAATEAPAAAPPVAEAPRIEPETAVVKAPVEEAPAIAPAPAEPLVARSTEPGTEAPKAAQASPDEALRALLPNQPPARAIAVPAPAPRARASASARERGSSRVATARSESRSQPVLAAPLMEDVQRLNQLPPPRAEPKAVAARPPATTANRCDRYNPYGEAVCIVVPASAPAQAAASPAAAPAPPPVGNAAAKGGVALATSGA